MAKKRVKEQNQQHSKQVVTHSASTENCKMIWIFDSVDVNGLFSFTTERDDFNAKYLFDTLLKYSKMTWAELRRQTHDNGKSTHHFLEPDGLSKEAMERIRALHLEEDLDCIFSVRLNNMLRIIGLRRDAHFVVKWYDPDHRFFPSHK